MSDPRQALARFVRHVVGDYRFERSYPAVVERANDDGSVDVLPEPTTMRGIGLQRVPTALSDPETRVIAEPGARCLLAFRAGDPQQPYIAAWEYAQDSATIQLAGGSAAVARKGDLVEISFSAASPIAGTMTATVSTPNPSPPPPEILTPVAPGTPFTGTVVGLGTVQAVVVGGAPKLKA